jgi:hypothetical protein
MDDEIVWERATGDDPVPEAKADEYINRRTASDADLWAIEVESREETPPLTDL